jgi:broad specificity phosphatase PhoE
VRAFRSIAVVRLILVRHGQTPSNVAGELDTAVPGAELTPLGHRQAAALPDALADEDVAGVYASVLVRTQLTAAPLASARGLAVVVCDGLEEVSAGHLEMRSDDASVSAYADTVTAWIAGDLDVVMPGGSDGHSFFGRFDAALGAIAGDHAAEATVVVFSHGAAIRTFAARHGGHGDDRLLNTGAVVLEGSPAAGWALTRWSRHPLGGAQLADETAHDVTGDPDPV